MWDIYTEVHCVAKFQPRHLSTLTTADFKRAKHLDIYRYKYPCTVLPPRVSKIIRQSNFKKAQFTVRSCKEDIGSDTKLISESVTQVSTAEDWLHDFLHIQNPSHNLSINGWPTLKHSMALPATVVFNQGLWGHDWAIWTLAENKLHIHTPPMYTHSTVQLLKITSTGFVIIAFNSSQV